MANIRQRGNTFQISVYVGEDKDGRKLFERTTFTPSESAPTKIKREVEAFAREFEDKVKRGRYFKGDKLSFCDVMGLWKDDQSYKDLTLRIKEDYESILNRWAVPALGKLSIGKITPVHVQTIYNEMEKEGKAPGTIKRVNTVINAVMKFAYRMEIIEHNPCDRVRLPKMNADTSLHYFDIDQSICFLEILKTGFTIIHKGHKRTLKKTGEEYVVPDYEYKVNVPTQFQAYYTVAIYSGFRRGEMVALTWEDIDFENETISINKSMAKTTSKGQIVKETKTVAGNREIKLPHDCFTILKEWKKEEREFSLKMGSAWDGFRGSEFDKNYVFIQTDSNCGHHMDIDTPRKKFREIIKRYNSTVEDESDKLPMIRLHDLRHTSATLLLSQGVDIETVSHRLGHSKPSITLDVYGHALESMDEVASNTLQNLLSKSG